MYTRSFDTDGQLTTHRVGSDIRTLTYDAASRITQTSNTNPAYNRTYDYDGLDRLTSQSDNSGFKLWGYDANSNRTTAQFGGTGYPYTVATDSNRLLNVAGAVTKIYSYDAAGNPLNDGATTFTWNAAGKLATTVNNAKTHTYKTNALDQRISKNGPLSSKFFFFYDPAGQLIGEYKDNSFTTTPADDWLVRQETIWLEDIPVAVIKKATTTSAILVYFNHTDHLNTPRVIVNQSNTPVWRWENTHAFGANLPDEDPDGNSQPFEYLLRFPGQYFDKETGLHYNYFRYYEPETGRYISPDPIGLAGGINVFGYVGQNPLRWIDPLGLVSLITDISAGTTTFDPRPEDPSGIPFTIQTRNGVDRRALPGAQDAFSTPNVRVRYRAPSKSYGPNGAYIDTGDTRHRNIHGGGSCPNNNFGDSQAPRQGWCVTLGCTRGQNEDVINLGNQIEDFQRRYPGTPIPYTRH